MGWKVVAVTGSVLVAALGGVGWAVAASATVPAPVIGPALVVSPAARDLPTSGPQESPGPPDSGTSPDTTPSVIPSGSAVPTPPVTGIDDAEPPETVDPQWVRPVEDDAHEHADGDGTGVDDD